MIAPTTMQAKKLINSPSTVVDDMIKGMLYTNPNLALINDLNVLVRADIESCKQRQVTLICKWKSMLSQLMKH